MEKSIKSCNFKKWSASLANALVSHLLGLQKSALSYFGGGKSTTPKFCYAQKKRTKTQKATTNIDFAKFAPNNVSVA